MVPSDCSGDFATSIRNDSKSLIAPHDYHVFLHSHDQQPFVRYEHPCRLPNARFQGYADRLPGVATLLRRQDPISTSEPLSFERDFAYEIQRHSPKTDSTFECWTPPSLTGRRPSVITSPVFKLVPLTAALSTTADKQISWSSNMDDRVPETTNQKLESQIEHSLPSSSVKWPPERIRGSGASQSKSSRYLREIDRRRILMRIAQGEKQSALAKEYHVSRAAICNLNKHRAQVLSRHHEHPLAKHPKRRTSTRSIRQDAMDHSIQSLEQQ